jgi:hypothetical protein
MTIRISAERTLRAPADVVYHCIADYREHHRPGGFLPPAFKEMRIEQGGIGDGTVVTVHSVIGGRPQTFTHHVTEPEPGRVLIEAGDGSSTRFSVVPEGADRCRVRFDTKLEANGVEALVTRLIAPWLLRPIYEDELRRLEGTAQTHAAERAA